MINTMALTYMCSSVVYALSGAAEDYSLVIAEYQDRQELVWVVILIWI